MRKILGSIGVILLGGIGQPVSAQVPVAGGTLSGLIDVGGRAFLSEPTDREWFRFGEYLDMRTKVFVPEARFRFNSGDRVFAEGRAFNLGRNDQQFAITAFRPGKFTFDLSWNQTPHLYTTTAQLVGGAAAVGNFSLPNPRPDTAGFNSAPFLDESLLSNRWDVGRIGLKVTPKPGWDLGAEYTRIKKNGNRPMGMSFGSPGNNHREILEPINTTAHSLKLSQGVGGLSRFQLRMNYELSVFHNSNDRVQADNPLAVTDVKIGNPSAGLSALSPSNLAHIVSLVATAARLPGRSSVVGTMAYSFWKQDEAFLAYTRNPADADSLNRAGVGTLPAPNLGGDKRTINLQLSANSRPVRNVYLTARYRRYETQDKTPDITFPVEVVSDRGITYGLFERETHPYTRQLGRFDVGLRPATPLNLKLGWNWERWNRSETRETPVTNEHQPRATADLQVSQYMSLRTSYSHAWRRYNEYIPVTTAQNPALRRFDESDRDQDRVDVITQISPPGPFGFTFAYIRIRNNYQVGQNVAGYGVLDDRSWSAGADASWTPNVRATIYAGYQQERVRVSQLSRFRANGVLDNLTYDWLSNTTDKVHTANAGIRATLVPEKLEFDGRWSFYDTETDVLTSNPNGAPACVAGQTCTTANNTSATAGDWNPITRRLHRIDGSLRYRILPNWSVMVNYGYQKLNESDWRTNGLVPMPAPPAVQGDVFLGGDVLPYQANYLVISVGYNFGMTPHATWNR